MIDSKFEEYKKAGTIIIKTDGQITIKDGLRWIDRLVIIEYKETNTMVKYEAYDDDGLFLGILTHNKNKSIDESLVKFQQCLRIRVMCVELVTKKERYEHAHKVGVTAKIIHNYY